MGMDFTLPYFYYHLSQKYSACQQDNNVLVLKFKL